MEGRKDDEERKGRTSRNKGRTSRNKGRASRNEASKKGREEGLCNKGRNKRRKE